MQLGYSAVCFETHVVLQWQDRNASSEDAFLFVPLFVAYRHPAFSVPV